MTEATEAATASRHASLMRAAAALRARSRSVPLETLFAILGAILMPVGVAAIILGWYGAAHTGHVYQQNDYLISGGLLGLGLTFIGGFLYFAYLMTRHYLSGSLARQQTLRALERIEARLASLDGVVTTNGSGEAASATTRRRDRAGATGLPLVATERGTLMHRPDCSVVSGRQNLRMVSSDDPNLRPCQICSPLASNL
jgi:hypothetical protein